MSRYFSADVEKAVVVPPMRQQQLVSIGVIGEYIAKTYMEVKHRPRYLVSERLESPVKKSDHT